MTMNLPSFIRLDTIEQLRQAATGSSRDRAGDATKKNQVALEQPGFMEAQLAGHPVAPPG